MTHAECAVAAFKSGHNCAQSVLTAFCSETGLSRDNALKLSSGFGAGMGRQQEVCGAVSGGILVLNLLFGRGENDAKEQQEIIYSKVDTLIKEFAAIHGTCSCRALLDDCNLRTPEGQQRFVAANMIERCYGYTETVAEILKNCIGADTQ